MPNEINLEKLEKYWTSKGLRMTWRRYRQIAKDGKVPEPVKGMVDALEALARLATYYQGMAEGDGDSTLTDERRRKTKAEADMAEIELKQLQGSLIPRDAVMQELVDRIYTLKTDLLALPKRLAKWPDAKAIADKFLKQLMRTYSQQKGVFKK
jgi:hypothetical protein